MKTPLEIIDEILQPILEQRDWWRVQAQTPQSPPELQNVYISQEVVLSMIAGDIKRLREKYASEIA